MGTKNALKHQIQKTHTACRRCGRTSFHIQKKVCAACGYPSARMRTYNWGKKMIRRKNEGTGRMRYKLRVFDVIRDADTGDRDRDLMTITSRVNRALGQGIVEAPEQWFWQSRRFRHRPEDEQPGPDGLPPVIPRDRAPEPMAAVARHRSPQRR